MISQHLHGITLIEAPSNLGLRPPAPGKEPGTWQAPAALRAAGLLQAVQPEETVLMPRPAYDFQPVLGTGLRNGFAVRAYNEALADIVEGTLDDERLPLIIGGDCSILLGALAGARRFGELSLVHVDGHSDFRHPGNYDVTAGPSAIAGMDLALATGRGEALLTEWDGRSAPLVADVRVVQIGERELHDPAWAWRDVLATEIALLDVFWAREVGMAAVLQRTFALLNREPELPFWLHFDVDVLDERLMPAVDSPGSPGLDYVEAASLLGGLLASPRCLGMDVTIFDPDLDPHGALASDLVHLLAQVSQQMRATRMAA